MGRSLFKVNIEHLDIVPVDRLLENVVIFKGVIKAGTHPNPQTTLQPASK